MTVNQAIGDSPAAQRHNPAPPEALPKLYG